MVRSLYKSADVEEDLPITWELMDGFRHRRAHFVVVLMPNSMMRSLYKSADMEEDLPTTLEPIDRFKSLKFAAEMTKNCCRKIDAKMPKISCRSAQSLDSGI